MMEWQQTLQLVAAMGSALVAGIFFAFSSFVMRALGQLPPAQGILAMQRINVTVLNPWFLGCFLGTGALCLPLGYLSVRAPGQAQSIYGLVACLAYLLGCFSVTMFANVPLNERLKSMDPDCSEAQGFWLLYQPRWTLWNHMRTLGAAAAAILFIRGLIEHAAKAGTLG